MATSTVFCLPSPSNVTSSPMMYEEFNQKKKPSTSSKSKAAPSSQSQTPSLPWLVQYWSSSLLQKPGMLMDQMFSCGAVDTTVATTVAAKPTKTFDTVKLDESYRINIEKNDTIGSHSIYFDETIANRATLPKPVSPTAASPPTTSATCTPFPKSNHRKTKSLSEKWNQLRSVVASHDDTNSYDYYEDVMMSVSADDDRHNNSREHPLSSCRQSKQDSFRNYRKSSIVVDDDEEDDDDDDDTNAFIQDCDQFTEDDDDIRAVSPFHNHENDDEEEDRDDEYDDDIRMAPPVSFSPTQSEVTAFRRPTKGQTKGPGNTRISNNVNKRDSLNSINTNSYMNLHTCHSFDQYIDTTHYLCATSESEHVKIKGATGATVSPTAAAAISSSPTKKPGSLRTPPRHQHTRTQTPEAYTTTAPLAKMGAPLRKSRTPPSPAKSTGADTYTTISLSHSYVHDFEQVTTGLENSELEEQDQDVRDLSTSSSHASLSSLIEDLDTKMNGHSLFLDRLANEQLVTPPRTSTTPPPPNSASLIRHGSPFRMKNNTSVSSHSHSQEEINNNIFGIVDDDEQDEDEDDSLASSSAFRSLIRMQTQNYQLASSLSLSTHDAAEIGVRAAAAAVRIRDASQDLAVFSTPSPTRVMPTSSPPSIVVPLHPHQRIIAPLPHRTESATFDNTDDNSEYTYSSCREATSSSHHAQHPRPRQLFPTTPSTTTNMNTNTNTNTTNPSNLAPMFPELW
mmetsp:Transcript_46130/g.53353  ORF Transcript_46130/g.53353 Transcript_46130/m.53353 type:complete len:735 (+) Transcript_46130:439-2643(+)